jgi:hypothetical protein
MPSIVEALLIGAVSFIPSRLNSTTHVDFHTAIATHGADTLGVFAQTFIVLLWRNAQNQTQRPPRRMRRAIYLATNSNKETTVRYALSNAT